MSIVRDNLLKDPNYVPYCPICTSLQRSKVNTILEFECSVCGWISSYPEDFKKEYIAAHKLEVNKNV